MPEKTEQEKLMEIMEALVEESTKNPDLDPKIFVRDYTSKLLNISEEETTYLTAHGEATHTFPTESEYENLWELYGLSEKAFTVVVQQARDLGMQDGANADSRLMEAWLQGYMIGLYMQMEIVKKMEASDA